MNKRKKHNFSLKKRSFQKKNVVLYKGIEASLVVVVVFVCFVIATVFMTIQTATSGAKLSYLEKEEERLLQERREINEKLLKAGSLSAVSEKAQDMGFAKATNVLYINQENIAKLP